MSSIRYRNLELEVQNEVYKPAEDTHLLAENLEVEEGEKILEIGTGSGLISILAAREGAEVTATDISSSAIECAKRNSEIAEVKERIDFRKGNLFEPIEFEKFDLILFNPPYLPVPESENLETELENAWDGGPDGRKVIDHFLDQFPRYLSSDGRVNFIQSSLSNPKRTIEKLRDTDMKVETKIKKLFFENLYFIMASPKKTS